MFIFCVIAIGLAVGLADSFFIRKNTSVKNAIATVLSDAVGINLVSLTIFGLLFNYLAETTLFPISSHKNLFVPLYAVATVLIGVLWLIIFAGAKGVLYLKESENKKSPLKVLTVISILLLTLGTAAFVGTVWGMQAFNGVASDQLIINITSPTEGTSDDVMNSFWSTAFLQLLSVLLIFVFVITSKYTLFYKGKNKEYGIVSPFVNKIICFLLSIAVLVGGTAYGIIEFKLIGLYDMYVTESTFIDDNYADPRNVRMQFPEKKRNLIHIYLESMENTYMSKDQGGYMDENLIPELTKLADEGISFSHSENSFGGPIATRGCVWSVASMVNMTTGLPMKVPTKAKQYGEKNGFLPGAVALGDILENQGYSCSLMFGASAKFGGLDYFYRSHGNFDILDYNAAKEKGWISEDYKEWWGFEDDKLFEFAQKELTRLGNSDEPFYFVMETADTHFPDGYVGVNTPTPRDSQYANVIAYSDSEVVKFVRWIQSQSFYENTTIVIIGDHLSMDSKFFENFDESYLRTTFNLILNPAEGLLDIPTERKFNRYWFNGDMFPTMLASIGVKIEGERLGLGTNLFSDKPTIMEENGEGLEGWKYVDEQFKYRSEYYVEKILSDNVPFDGKNITTY